MPPAGNRPQAPSARTWMFTYWPEGETAEEQFPDFAEEQNRWLRYAPEVRRVLIGLEYANEGDARFHLQGKITFLSAKRLSTLKKLVDNKPYHWEVAATTDFLYEMKGETVVNVNNSNQGARIDLKEAMAAASAGASRLDLMESHTMAYARYDKFLHAYVGEKNKYTGIRNVFWFYGATGSGKTRLADELLTPLMYESVTFQKPFFLGYNGSNYVLLDDIRSDSIGTTMLLRILDRYAVTVPVKGTEISWNAKIVVITSEFPPQNWDLHAGGDQAQLLRRCETGGVFAFPHELQGAREALAAAINAHAPQQAVPDVAHEHPDAPPPAPQQHGEEDEDEW